MKINLNSIPLAPSHAEYINGEWHMKTDGPTDETKPQGSYVVFMSDGSVYRRTLDQDGFIIHELKIR